MQFSEVLASMTRDGDTWSATVPDSWLQGRSLFGGLQSAMALRAMRALVPESVPLRVLQTTFVAPVPAGPVRVRGRILRTGKNAVHAEARVVNGDTDACLVVAVFGSSRSSRVVVTPTQRAVKPRPTIELPFIPGVTPNFGQHFSMRWLEGGLPYTGMTEPGAVVQVGLRDSGPVREEHVLAIADSVPPMALSMLDTPAAGSSLTWTFELLTTDLAQLPLEGYRLDCELVAGRDGYTSQSVMVWGPGAEPVALSRQSMVVFG